MLWQFTEVLIVVWRTRGWGVQQYWHSTAIGRARRRSQRAQLEAPATEPDSRAQVRFFWHVVQEATSREDARHFTFGVRF